MVCCEKGRRESYSTTKVIKETTKYIGRRYLDRGNVFLVIYTRVDLNFPVYILWAKGEHTVNTIISQTELKVFVARIDRYRVNLWKSFCLIHGQCTDYMWDKIKALENCNTDEAYLYMLAPLHGIKKLVHKHGERKYP